MKIEELFVSSLGSVSKLKWYLDNNSNVVNYMPPTTIFSISIIPKDIFKHMIKDVNMQRILKILEKERLDLYKVINTKKGLVWLNREIQSFKDYFLK